ncbi:uncharacterized protein LOC109402254 [Aedes albopictus]|uniref:Secreted protein n=1 Tax=Aedes albopictus TaxID=7160 RepID=A0ABM1ZXU7_AEDAL
MVAFDRHSNAFGTGGGSAGREVGRPSDRIRQEHTKGPEGAFCFVEPFITTAESESTTDIATSRERGFTFRIAAILACWLEIPVIIRRGCCYTSRGGAFIKSDDWVPLFHALSLDRGKWQQQR